MEHACHSSYRHVDKIAHKLIEPFGQRALIYLQVTYLSLTNPLPPSIPQQPTPPPNPHITIKSSMLNRFHEEVHKYWHHCIAMYVHTYVYTPFHIPYSPHSSSPTLSSPLHPSYHPSLSLTFSPPPFPPVLLAFSSFLSPTLFTSQVKPITQYTTMSYLTTSHIMQRYLHWQGLPAYRFCSFAFLHLWAHPSLPPKQRYSRWAVEMSWWGMGTWGWCAKEGICGWRREGRSVWGLVMEWVGEGERGGVG